MAVFKVETKNKVDINKKPRVYFTCHPDDFGKYFKKICKDIFKTHDCAIYYTEDMTEVISDDEKQVDLGRNNLFVIPVTFKLLAFPNRAMNEDIPYALKEHIPILPIMMESGIDELYSKADKFGELQYLNPLSTDLTEISYEDKLKKYLESVLISDELAKSVRAAFEAYIFLSYRKKDRKYANELMRLIHSYPECRDIAIWFDEFLVPGESFKENIEIKLNDCQLFTLLVTTHILEKVIDKNGDVRDNYVISTELPLARMMKEKKGINIFAVEMEDTDKDILSAISIDHIVNIEDSEFNAQLRDAISSFLYTIDDSPEHIYLIGLAYMDGIDVEVNRERAVELITKAAECGLHSAIKKLVAIYSNGLGHELDLAIEWQSRLLKLIEKDEFSDNKFKDDFINELLLISSLYERCGRINEAIDARNKVNIIYEEMLAGSANISEYLYSYVQNIYTIAKLISYDDTFENQNLALNYLSKAVELISNSYYKKIEDTELSIISGLFETIAQYLINKSRRFDKKIDSEQLAYNARKIRRIIEEFNEINLTTWLRSNGLHYKDVEMSVGNFYLESGLHDILGHESIDTGTDYVHTNPLFNAEELLIMSVAIYDYLASNDLENYMQKYVRSLSNVASLWIMLGAYPRAIETLNMNIQFLQVYENEFNCNEWYIKVKQFELLAEAYKNNHDRQNAIIHLKNCLQTIESHQDSRDIQLQLSRIYKTLSNVSGECADSIVYLKKSIDLLEGLQKTNALLDKEIFILIDCYCCLLSKYVTPDFWNSEEFFRYFNVAYELCETHIPLDELQVAIFLNTLHCLRIVLEDCKTIESIQLVGTLFNLAFNNCKTLLLSDSEHSNPFWFKTISEFSNFNIYAQDKFSSEKLREWENICVKLVAKYLSFIIELADETPLTLIDHNYRMCFSDYALITGQADNKFIEHYKSLLYVFFQLFIEMVYKKGLANKELDIVALIKQVYSKVISCQEQGYAFQIFNKEQKLLLELVTT